MKKLLLFSAVAAMFASCSSDNENYIASSQNQKITFSAPVLSKNTRVASDLAGTGAVTGVSYPENQSFKVFAVRTAKTGYTVGNWDNGFMNAVTASKGTTYWEPVQDYYWPKNGDVISFAAYSPHDLVDDAGCTSVAYGNNGLEVKDYLLHAEVAKQTDLMYTERVLNKTKSDGTMGIPLNFKHALSLLNFTVETETPVANSTIKLKSITINNAYDKGTFSEKITDNTTYSAAPEWSALAYKTPSTSSFVVFTGEQKVINSPADVPSASVANVLMIPQILETPNPTLTITWSYTNGGTGGAEVEDQLTINLNDLDIHSWLIGKKYTYNIKINLDKIYFNPTVTDWDDGSDSEPNPNESDVKP